MSPEESVKNTHKKDLERAAQKYWRLNNTAMDPITQNFKDFDKENKVQLLEKTKMESHFQDYFKAAPIAL